MMELVLSLRKDYFSTSILLMTGVGRALRKINGVIKWPKWEMAKERKGCFHQRPALL